MQLDPIIIDDSIADQVCAALQANFGWNGLDNKTTLANTRSFILTQLIPGWIANGQTIIAANAARAQLSSGLLSKIT